MQPIEFQGKRNQTSLDSYLLWVVAVVGLVAGLVVSSAAFALVWGLVWSALGYLKYRRGRRDIQRFKMKLDDLGINIKDRRRSWHKRWDEIDRIEWRSNGSDCGDDLFFISGNSTYVYDRLLDDVDFSDLIQALKIKVPDKAPELGRHYYNTRVHGLVLEAHQLRTLKHFDKAATCYRQAIEEGERSASPLGLGMIPVLEEYAALLDWQGKQAEAQMQSDKIAALVRRVAI